MNESARKLKNEYQKQWRSANKDKVKMHNENYWERLATKGSKETKKTCSGDCQCHK